MSNLSVLSFRKRAVLVLRTSKSKGRKTGNVYLKSQILEGTRRIQDLLRASKLCERGLARGYCCFPLE